MHIHVNVLTHTHTNTLAHTDICLVFITRQLFLNMEGGRVKCESVQQCLVYEIIHLEALVSFFLLQRILMFVEIIMIGELPWYHKHHFLYLDLKSYPLSHKLFPPWDTADLNHPLI